MNKMLKKVFFATAVSIACASVPAAFAADEAAVAAPKPEELAAFKRAIRAQYDLKEKSWAAGDYSALVKGFYAPTAFNASEGEPEHFAIGRSQFLEMYKTFVADVTKVRVESIHTYVNGNMGWDWTNFYADVKPAKVKDYPPTPVRILFLWEKIDGKWICTGDVVLLGKFTPPAAAK